VDKKLDLLRKDPEIAIHWQFLAPETAPFWRFLDPEYGTRNHQNDAVSGAINCQKMAISAKIVDRSFMVTFTLQLQGVPKHSNGVWPQSSGPMKANDTPGLVLMKNFDRSFIICFPDIAS
jgi:hypothetical protein